MVGRSAGRRFFEARHMAHIRRATQSAGHVHRGITPDAKSAANFFTFMLKRVEL